MSRGKKNQQHQEDFEEDQGSSVASGEPGGSEMMLMFRAMMAEQRRADEAREERREEVRVKRELELADRQAEVQRKRELELAERQAEIQRELEKRQYEQQVSLLKLQQEMGEKASVAHREYQSVSQKRDRALYTIPILKEGEDVEEFLSTAERRLSAADVKKEDWVAVIDAKLSGKTASVWQDILAKTGSYQEAKDGLLKACGYTPKSAAEKFFGFKVDQLKGLTADQIYHRGQQLLRRVVAPEKMGEKMEFAILRGWLGGVVPKRAKAALDARAAEDSVGIVNALRDFLELEGDRTDGQNATFKRNSGEFNKDKGFGFSRDKGYVITCFKCGKQGHRAVDCWKGGAGSGRTGNGSSGGGAPRVITCFTCQEEGHESPQCPRNIRGEKGGSKDAKPKPVKRVWQSHPGKCTRMCGVIDGQDTDIC